MNYSRSNRSLTVCAGILLAAAIPMMTFALPADTPLAAALRADYPLTKVGISMLKFDYNRITQPGVTLTVRIPGIYADIANTPQAIVTTNIENGQANQQRGFLASLSNTSQSRVLNVNEAVYVTRLDVKPDAVHLELLTVNVSTLGTGAGTRYRAEVNVRIPNLANKSADEVKTIIDAALADANTGAPPADGQMRQTSAPTQSAAPVQRNTTGLAPITPEQKQQIDAQLDRAPAALKPQVAAAHEIIANYVATVACSTAYSTSRLQTYLGPHGDISGFSNPVLNMRYHDKGSCLDVTRLQGWTALSLNAFGFQAVYTAVDSGESTTRQHEVQREPDGTWLMNH